MCGQMYGSCFGDIILRICTMLNRIRKKALLHATLPQSKAILKTPGNVDRSPGRQVKPVQS